MEDIRLFKALSDKTRYDIIKLLTHGEKCVCEIYPLMNRTQSTVSIQLGKLEDWGILKSRRDGKRIYYHIVNKRIIKIIELASKEVV